MSDQVLMWMNICGALGSLVGWLLLGESRLAPALRYLSLFVLIVATSEHFCPPERVAVSLSMLGTAGLLWNLFARAVTPKVPDAQIR